MLTWANAALLIAGTLASGTSSSLLVEQVQDVAFDVDGQVHKKKK